MAIHVKINPGEVYRLFLEGISKKTLLLYCYRKTRTCIHTPGFPPMIPDDLSKSNLSSALDGVRLFYSDVRLHETALVIAHEVIVFCFIVYLLKISLWY